MNRKKTVRELMRAQPDNYFITVSEIEIRIPWVTGQLVGMAHNEPFILTHPDWRTIILNREPKGKAICKHYRHTMKLYGRWLIVENRIKLGRYQYCPEQSNEKEIVFKYDSSWV